MSREHNHDAFKKWAEERLEDMRRRACLFCGYPTRHPSQTCPAHRDLARTIPGFDVPDGYGIESPDDSASGMGGAGVASDVASGAPPDPRRVDSGSA